MKTPTKIIDIINEWRSKHRKDQNNGKNGFVDGNPRFSNPKGRGKLQKSRAALKADDKKELALTESGASAVSTSFGMNSPANPDGGLDFGVSFAKVDSDEFLSRLNAFLGCVNDKPYLLPNAVLNRIQNKLTVAQLFFQAKNIETGKSETFVLPLNRGATYDYLATAPHDGIRKTFGFGLDLVIESNYVDGKYHLKVSIRKNEKLPAASVDQPSAAYPQPPAKHSSEHTTAVHEAAIVLTGRKLKDKRRGRGTIWKMVNKAGKTVFGAKNHFGRIKYFYPSYYGNDFQ